MLIELTGRRCRATFSAHLKGRTYTLPEDQYYYRSYGKKTERWWEAETRIVDGNGRDVLCILKVEACDHQESEEAFASALLGAWWRSDRVVSRGDYLDLVLCAIAAKCPAESKHPLPRIRFRLGPGGPSDTPDVDVRDLIAAGILLDERGQRFLPFAAAP